MLFRYKERRVGACFPVVSLGPLTALALAVAVFFTAPLAAEQIPTQATGSASSCSSEEVVNDGAKSHYKEHEGKRIASIRVRQVYVFDEDNPEENNAIFRFMNRLHIHTRPGVIRSQLLVEEGDILDPELVAGSERILRRQPYLGEARIYVDEDCGDEVALLVVTRDVWTTEPEISLGFAGGEAKHGFAISENNVAGTGNAFSVGYSKNEDRRAWLYDFYSPHLMNSRWSLHLGLATASDGRRHVISLEQPFYSMRTRWAAGLHNEETTLEEPIRFGGEEVSSFGHTFENNQLYGGRAFSIDSEASQRVRLGISQERHVFEPTDRTVMGVPQDYNAVYPWIQYQYVENKFAVYTNLDQMHRTEDVSIGSDWFVRLGYGGSALGNNADVVRVQARYADLAQLGSRQILRFQLHLDSRSYPGHELSSESLMGAEFAYYFLTGEKHRWFASIRYDHGDGLQQHNELTNDQVFGLRGYPVGYQRGDSRYLVTLEKRYITDYHLFNVLRLGSVFYLDAGRSWGAGYGDSSHLSNVGLGLRLSSSKARVGKVLHLDLAYPLADKNRVDSYQWVITAANSF